jgi:holin (3TMs family)
MSGFDWKSVAGDVAKVAPVLGGILTGPAGIAVEAAGALITSALGATDPAQIPAVLQTNPDAAIKLQQLENEKTLGLQQLSVTDQQNQLNAQIQILAAINATMQSETKSDHWPSYSWRPYIGFVLGTMIFGVYFVLPLLNKTVPTIPSEVWMALGGILGVASYFRGKMQADPNVATDNRG